MLKKNIRNCFFTLSTIAACVQGNISRMGNNNEDSTTVKFARIEEEYKKRGYFTSEAPSYRTIWPGFNLEGECKNQNCKACGKLVWANLGFDYSKFDCNGCFNIAVAETAVSCPLCKKVLKRHSMIRGGFYMCRYSMYGKMYEPKKETYKPSIGGGITFDKDSFDDYGPNRGNEDDYLFWAYLKVKVWKEKE